MNEEFSRYVAEHGRLPDQPDGSKRSCQELKESADYSSVRNLLDSCGSGDIPAEAVLSSSCDEQAGEP